MLHKSNADNAVTLLLLVVIILGKLLVLITAYRLNTFIS